MAGLLHEDEPASAGLLSFSQQLPTASEIEQLHSMFRQQFGAPWHEYVTRPVAWTNREQNYDYLAALRGGAELGPDSNGVDMVAHWPSQFKGDSHPSRFEFGQGQDGDVGPRLPGTVYDRRSDEVVDMSNPKNRQDVLDSLFNMSRQMVWR